MTCWSLKLRVDKAENIGDPSHKGDEVYLCRIAWGSTIVRTYSGRCDGSGTHTFDMLIRLPPPETENSDLRIDLLDANDSRRPSFAGVISREFIEGTKNAPKLISTKLSPRGTLSMQVELVGVPVVTPSVERVTEPTTAFPHISRSPLPPQPDVGRGKGVNSNDHSPVIFKGPQRRFATLNSNLSFADDGQQSEGGLSYVTAQHSVQGFHSPILSSEALFDATAAASLIRRVDPRRILATNTATPRYALERSTLDIPTARPVRLSREALDAMQPAAATESLKDPTVLTNTSLIASQPPVKSSLSSNPVVLDNSPILSRVHGQHQRSSTLGGGCFGVMYSNTSYLRTNPAATMPLRSSPSAGPRSMSPAAGRRFHLPLSRIDAETSGPSLGELRNRRTYSIASSSPVPDLKLSTSIGSSEGQSHNGTMGGASSGPRLSPTNVCVLSCTNMAAELCLRYNAKTRYDNVTKIIEDLSNYGRGMSISPSPKRSRRVYHSYTSLYLYLNRLSFVSQDTNSRWRVQGQDTDVTKAGMIKGVIVTLDQDKRGSTTMKILTPISDDEPYAHLLIPIESALRPTLTITLWYAERTNSQPHIQLPLCTLLEHGMTGLEGYTHFFTQKGSIDPSVAISFAIKFTPHFLITTSCLMERNPRISISTITQRGNAHEGETESPAFGSSLTFKHSMTPVPSPTSTTPLEILIRRYNQLSVTLLTLDEKFKLLPDTINGESTEILACKVSLGMTAGLKSFLSEGWRDSIRRPVPHKFLYNGERILRICLSCTKKAVVCQLRIDLHKLLRMRVDTFRSAVQVTTTIDSLKGATAEILLEFTKQEAMIPASPALSWRSALDGAKFLRLCIEEIRANDLSCLHKTFTMRVSCGPVKLKSTKLKVPDHETNRMQFENLVLDIPVTESFLSKTEEKSIILSIYVKNEETKQNHVFQLLKLTCSYFLVPSKLPRIWSGEILLNLAPGTPADTPRCCVRLALIISDGVVFNLSPCDADETPRIKKVQTAQLSPTGERSTPATREPSEVSASPPMGAEDTAILASASAEAGDPANNSTIESQTEQQSIGAETSLSIDDIDIPEPPRFGLLVSSNSRETLQFALLRTAIPTTPAIEVTSVIKSSFEEEEPEAPHIRQHVSKSWTEQRNFRSWLIDIEKAYMLKITDEDFKESYIMMSFPQLLIDSLKDKSWGIPINEGETMRMSTEDGAGPVKFFRSTPGNGKNSEVVRLAIISMPPGTND